MERTNENIVSSFFFYMWNGWGTKEECRQVFGYLCDHFWDKWCEFYREYRGGAAEMFYAGLSDDNRRKLVDRACAVYNGNSLATPVPSPELMAKISSHLHTLGQLDQHNELSLIFWNEQKSHEIDMQPWIDEWHACECDFAAWYAKLPADMQTRAIEYYRNLLKS